VNEFDEKAEFKQDEQDLKRVIKTLQRIKKPGEDEAIPKDDYLYEELGNFDDGFLSGDYGKKRSIIQQMTDAKALSALVKSGSNQLFTYLSGRHSKLGSRDIRFKVCRYAEIFLSDEIRKNVESYKWNVDAYLEFNRCYFLMIKHWFMHSSSLSFFCAGYRQNFKVKLHNSLRTLAISVHLKDLRGFLTGPES
jgi:hypothetical protein